MSRGHVKEDIHNGDQEAILIISAFRIDTNTSISTGLQGHKPSRSHCAMGHVEPHGSDRDEGDPTEPQLTA
jgi:hypothetical protein